MGYKFKIGDEVQTPYGVGEVLFIDYIYLVPYLVGIKGFRGHSGREYMIEKTKQEYVIDKGYKNQCKWFYENELELIKEEK